MDNRRLIDADKLLEWLGEIIKAHIMFGQNERVYAYKDVKERIMSGAFDPDPIPPTIKPGDWAIHPDLEQVRIMDAPVVHVLKGKDEYEVYLADLEVISHD